MTKIEIEIDDSVKAELDYIMMFADKDKNFYYEDIGSVLSYLATAWADAGRRPGSWERGCFNQLGLIPECDQLNYYRQRYGDPAFLVDPASSLEDE